MNVALYGDKHTSEKYAKQIQQKVASQDPNVMMKEAPQLRGKESSHIMSSLVKFASLGEIYNAFDLDVTKLDESKRKRYRKAMYKIDAKKLKESLDALYNRYDIKADLNEFSNPETTVLTPERDKAITSLHRNLDCKIDNRKNTLTPRLCLLIKKHGADFYNIDMPEKKWAKWAAKNIESAPSTPKGVLTLIERKRSGDLSARKERVVKKILKKTKKPRDKAMATQIYDSIDEDGYSNIAAIMGASHVRNVKKHLQNQGVSAEIRNK